MSKEFLNIPNAITLVRLILIPFIIYFMYFNTSFYNLVATIIFIIACMSDYFDGLVARLNKVVTDFGKIFDQIVDKILVASVLIILVENGRVQGWIVVILLAREFAISGMRNYLSYKGIIVPAFASGKIKTTSQMAAIMCLLLYDKYFGVNFYLVGTMLIYIALFFSIYSFFEYSFKLFKIK
jgi:CDP-diacylglycerol--glycerol-3-phosphate 3-phosphatidyltransferase